MMTESSMIVKVEMSLDSVYWLGPYQPMNRRDTEARNEWDPIGIVRTNMCP